MVFFSISAFQWGFEVGDGADLWGLHESEMGCRIQLLERGREELIGEERIFHLSLLTGHQRVRMVWRATSALVIKM